MPIDRAATLRNAEKLLRQGKLELAIPEYLRVTSDQPRDWNTANLLGDLYIRAGQVDLAIAQFTRIADSLSEEGFLQRAGALYKKVLKLKPNHEHALLQSAEVAATQGLLADARSYLNTLIEQRRGRGDFEGAARARVRLGLLDPEDFSARAAAARARIEFNDVAGAVDDLKKIAAELLEKGRRAEAIEVLRSAAAHDRLDDEIRDRLMEVYVAAGELTSAREWATTVEQLKSLAGALDARGDAEGALETLGLAARLDPSALDPGSLLAVARTQLRGPTPDEGVTLIRRLLGEDPAQREAVALVGWTIAGQRPEVGFRLVELAADTAVTHADWPGAAAILQEFANRVPHHVPALLRLVEICVDGGLERDVFNAQALLADAYLEAGAVLEARFIAEDLADREPGEKANIARFRRALVLLGESDPDAVIAERLNVHSPSAASDFSFEGEEVRAVDPDLQAVPETTLEVTPPVEEAPQFPLGAARDNFELGPNAVDLAGLLEEIESPRGTAHAASDIVEVDLSIVLNDVGRQAAPAVAAQGRAPARPSLDGVFADLRGEAAQQGGLTAAEELYKRGLALRDAGDFDGCIQALQAASRAPALRFTTAVLIGQLFRGRGMMPEAVEWFEQAAQAPAPTTDETHQLLYELADVLEEVGEGARALAVLLELQAEAGEYRDVESRIDRLTKVQARG